MTELELDELESNLAENNSYQEERSADIIHSNLGEVKDILSTGSR